MRRGACLYVCMHVCVCVCVCVCVPTCVTVYAFCVLLWVCVCVPFNHFAVYAWLLWKSRLLTLASLLLTCLVSWNYNYSLSVFSVALLFLYWNLLSVIHLSGFSVALCYSPLTSLWNPYTAFTCLVSWNPCCAVYTCSCSVWGHWACLTSWPSQPWGRVLHTLALVLQSVLLEGV